MAFCTNCGNKLTDNDTFCPRCGTPVKSKIGAPSVADPINEDMSEASSQPGEVVIGSWRGDMMGEVADDNMTSGKDAASGQSLGKSKGKKILGGILGLVLPVVLVVAGAGIYGFFTGSGGGGEVPKGGSDPMVIDQRPNTSGNDLSDVVPHGEMPTSDQSIDLNESASDALDTSDALDDLVGLDGLEGLIDLDDMSESERKAHEERLFGTSASSGSLGESYEGTWVSVGVVVLNYRDIADYLNGDLGRLIDQKMVSSENVMYVLSKGNVKIWIGGKLNISGKYYVRESGNISVETETGDSSIIWMYSPDNSTLYSYLYFVDDDGTEKASCIKFKRTK